MLSLHTLSKRFICSSKHVDAKLIVFNAGSSTLKYKLFELGYETQEKAPFVSKAIFSGLVELSNLSTRSESKRNGRHTHRCHATNEVIRLVNLDVPKHSDALDRVVSSYLSNDVSSIKFVGHRVVHGGEKFHEACVIDSGVLSEIKNNEHLAPLHNPSNVAVIATAERVFGNNATQVAVFDTAFHAKMPPRAYMYALPHKMYTDLKIRRYGFHGTSHQFVANKAAESLGRPLGDLNIITLHLGNGSSVAAIQRGVCIDTSMGFTPLEGLVMGTRCGDIDPSIPSFISSNLHISLPQVDEILNKQSGLYGLCGESDVREITSKITAGGDTAAMSNLALDVFVHRVRKYLGSYWIQLAPRLDVIVFTAGIGENSALVRERVCQNLEFIGLKIDQKKNEAVTSVKEPIQIQDKLSSVKVLVIPTDEELSIAHQTLQAAAL